MKYIFRAISDQQSAIRKKVSLHQKTSFLKAESRKPKAIFILFCIAVALFQVTGCTVTFTQSDTPPVQSIRTGSGNAVDRCRV